jgi:PAS domain S-box-containing protein
VAGKPKVKSAREDGTARERAGRGSFARGERERLLERERAARAEAERARQEIQGILESISDGFFAIDRERRFVYVNREAERFWGKPREDLMGKDIREMFPSAVGTEGFRAIERAEKEGVATEFEMASSVVPGAWVAGRVYPSAEGLSVYFRDVSQRKRAEEALRDSQEALRKSEEFHRFAVEAGRIGTWDLDLQTEECLISPTMADLMGFSPDQTTVPGAQWQESIVPDDRSLLASALATSIESDAPFDLEFRIALKDGTERWLYSRGGVTSDASGKALRVYGVSIDVTERKRAEEKLLKSEERLQRAIGIETVGVIFFKVDGSITDSNDAFLRMSGYSREDLEQGKVWWDVMTPPEWMPHSLKAIEEFESTGRTKPYEKEYVRKDGSRWWGLFAATRLDEEEGVEFIIDITERKRAQEEHERLLARGWKARAEAEERKRISRELHDRVAHAMGVVHQSLELHEVLKHPDPETARAKIALAKETTKEAMSLTRNLSQELRGKEVQAGLSAALSDLLETAVPPGLDCAVCVEGEEALVPPHVREELFVILREGVRNVVSHAGASRVEVGIRVSSEEVLGYVEDDGRGFVEEDGGYTGGGVRSMRERAEMVGGTFELSSSPGVGTTIRASIPFKRGPGKGA